MTLLNCFLAGLAVSWEGGGAGDIGAGGCTRQEDNIVVWSKKWWRLVREVMWREEWRTWLGKVSVRKTIVL